MTDSDSPPPTLPKKTKLLPSRSLLSSDSEPEFISVIEQNCIKPTGKKKGKETSKDVGKWEDIPTPRHWSISNYFDKWKQGFTPSGLRFRRGVCNIKNGDEKCSREKTDRSTSSFGRHLNEIHGIRKVDGTEGKTDVPLASTQSDIRNHMNRVTKFTRSDPRQKKINEAICDFCVKKVVPLTGVISKEFRNVILVAEPRWREVGYLGLISLIRQKSEACTIAAKKLLQKNKGRISNEVDLWTDRRCRSFMAIYGTVISSTFERKKVLMAFEYVPGSHTGQAIKEVYQNSLHNLGISEEDVVRFVLFLYSKISFLKYSIYLELLQTMVLT